MNKISFIFCIALLLTGCKANRSLKQDGLIVLDVNQIYPEKEIFLSEIADIRYVQLDDDDDDYLFSGFPVCVTEQTIVVFDRSDGDFLFFTKDGKPKSKFNRKGNGPGEYVSIRVGLVCYGEKNDDLYILGNKKIDVFSSTGEHKRTLPLPDNVQVSEFLLFGENSILLFDDTSQIKGSAGFIFISSFDGRKQDQIALPYDYSVELTKELVLEGRIAGVLSERFDHILKKTDGEVLLHIAENDTLYLYNHKKALEPVMVQIPSKEKMEPIIYINSFIQTDRYQFVELITVQIAKNNRFPSTHLVRDRNSRNLYTQKIIFDDYKKKGDVIISSRLVYRTHRMDEGLISIPVHELQEANRKGELSGKLKTFIEQIKEENENDVLVFLSFK